MSASDAPSPDEVADRFPVTPDEAQVIADAVSPFQDIAGSGAAIGSAIESAPGPGPKLLGTLLQNLATHVDLASVSAETLARALAFYVDAQAGSFETLFPPPHEAIVQFSDDIAPLTDAIEQSSGYDL